MSDIRARLGRLSPWTKSNLKAAHYKHLRETNPEPLNTKFQKAKEGLMKVELNFENETGYTMKGAQRFLYGEKPSDMINGSTEALEPRKKIAELRRENKELRKKLSQNSANAAGGTRNERYFKRLGAFLDLFYFSKKQITMQIETRHLSESILNGKVSNEFYNAVMAQNDTSQDNINKVVHRLMVKLDTKSKKSDYEEGLKSDVLLKTLDRWDDGLLVKVKERLVDGVLVEEKDRGITKAKILIGVLKSPTFVRLSGEQADKITAHSTEPLQGVNKQLAHIANYAAEVGNEELFDLSIAQLKECAGKNIGTTKDICDGLLHRAVFKGQFSPSKLTFLLEQVSSPLSESAKQSLSQLAVLCVANNERELLCAILDKAGDYASEVLIDGRVENYILKSLSSFIIKDSGAFTGSSSATMDSEMKLLMLVSKSHSQTRGKNKILEKRDYQDVKNDLNSFEPGDSKDNVAFLKHYYNKLRDTNVDFKHQTRFSIGDFVNDLLRDKLTSELESTSVEDLRAYITENSKNIPALFKKLIAYKAKNEQSVALFSALLTTVSKKAAKDIIARYVPKELVFDCLHTAIANNEGIDTPCEKTRFARQIAGLAPEKSSKSFQLNPKMKNSVKNAQGNNGIEILESEYQRVMADKQNLTITDFVDGCIKAVGEDASKIEELPPSPPVAPTPAKNKKKLRGLVFNWIKKTAVAPG